jgi:hypothetical protein
MLLYVSIAVLSFKYNSNYHYYMKNQTNVYLCFQGYENVEGFIHLSVMTIIPKKGAIIKVENDLIELYAQYFEGINMDIAKWCVIKITESIGVQSHSIYIT